MAESSGTSAQRPDSGTVVVISGPSGSGKTSISRDLEKLPGYRRSVSATTRTPRTGERDGVDYHFVTREAFMERVEQGAFLEHAEYLGQLYGTPLDQTEHARRKDGVLILEIDVQGAEQVMQKLPQAVCIFIMPPPDDAELERRLRGRKTDHEAVIRARLDHAKKEVARCERFQHRVINDDLSQAVAEVKAIIERERQGRSP